ncbi:hypothetical protein Tco_1232318, partial [Tanacetum coccineum]
MIKTRMKTPPLDQTEGRREGDQANKLIHQKNRHIRSQSPQVLQKVHPDLNQNLQASLLMQRSMNNRMMIKKINHIKSSTQGMMMMCISGIHQNAQGRQVIPLDYFINNDLEYLKGGSSSQKYTTSITKTKAADYGHVKWIEDKFSDGTLNNVCTALNDIATGIEMEYLPKRKWSKQDKQRARVMINAVDKKLRDRRLMRNLEKFVGGRPYVETYGCWKEPYDLSYVVLLNQ